MDSLNKIIQKSSLGDPKAQRALYEKYRVKWYMISMRYGKNKMQADDIFQEGLIQIYKDLHQFNQKKSQFSTWSSRVLVNAALRFLKKNNWIETLSNLDEVSEYEDTHETIYDKIATKELTELVQNLPVGYRIVFNMNALEGFTHKEIADILGISEGTSKSQLSKARKLLRKNLESQLKIISI